MNQTDKTCDRWADDGQSQCGKPAPHLFDNDDLGRAAFCTPHALELDDPHNGWVPVRSYTPGEQV